MKSLSTLIKLQKTRVDEQRILLARLQDRLDFVVTTIRQLEEQKVHEGVEAAKNPANAVTYGAFLKRAVHQGRDLDRERQIAEAAVSVAHEKLTELFEEQKRYEIAEAARVAEERREELRRETAELDEIGGVVHERQKKKE